MEKDEQSHDSGCGNLEDTMGCYSGILMPETTYFDVYNSSSQRTDIPDKRVTYICESAEKTSDSFYGQSSSKEQATLTKPTHLTENEADSHNSQIISDNDYDLFECGICTEDLSTPKSLPCLHNFCLQCLEKYFTTNCLYPGETFRCPTCRASVRIPQGGVKMFPTNFHIINLRRNLRELDMGQTIKEAIQYLDNRAEEIVDEISERKRQVLIAISKRRENLITQIEDLVEEFLESVEEQYTNDSTKSVNTISAVKEKLSQLQTELKDTCLDVNTKTSVKQTEAIQLNALTKLRRQAEIISNLNNELEELKQEADQALTSILDKQLAFCNGECRADELKQIFGRLIILTDGQTLDDFRSEERDEEGFSPLHVKSWSQSWWVLLFAILPAVICAMFVKVILTILEKLLG